MLNRRAASIFMVAMPLLLSLNAHAQIKPGEYVLKRLTTKNCLPKRAPCSCRLPKNAPASRVITIKRG